MKKNGLGIKMLDWDLGYLGSVPIHVSDCLNDLGDIVLSFGFLPNVTCLTGVRPSPPQSLSIKQSYDNIQYMDPFNTGSQHMLYIVELKQYRI